MNKQVQIEIESARRYFEEGRPDRTDRLCRRILEQDPKCAGAWHWLGRCLLLAQQYSAAADCFQRAIEIEPKLAPHHYRLAQALEPLHDFKKSDRAWNDAITYDSRSADLRTEFACYLARRRQFEESAIEFRYALSVDAKNTNSRFQYAKLLRQTRHFAEAIPILDGLFAETPKDRSIGVELCLCLRDTGQVDRQIELLEQMAKAKEEDFEVQHQLGVARAKRGELPAAKKAFELAAKLAPERASVPNNLGNVLRGMGQLEQAEICFRKAICLDPTDANFQVNLAALLAQQFRFDEAIVNYQNALKLSDKRVDALRGLATVYFNRREFARSIATIKRAIEMEPGNGELVHELANSLREAGDFAKAEKEYRRAIELLPKDPAVFSNLGSLLVDAGRTSEGKQNLALAYSFQPTAKSKILSEIPLPVILPNKEIIPQLRADLTGSLDRAFEKGERIDPSVDMFPTLFYLAYHGEDDRAIHEKMARLACEKRRLVTKPAPAPNNGRLRVAFISRFFFNHTIARLNHGLIEKLPRDRFEVSVISIGMHRDQLGERVRQSADRFMSLPPAIGPALERILRAQPQLLFFTDIGMDPFSYTLAFHRLAPVQMATWGHPMTTGLPTMDYFLSSEDLDTADAQKYYTEKLVRLPRLSVAYERSKLEPEPIGRSFFGLPDRATLYGIPQTLFKFHPDFDEVLANILEQDKQGYVVMLDGRFAEWKTKLLERWKGTLGDLVKRVIFLPPQPHDLFLRLNNVCDVLLDPIHFGGGNTTYEALGLGKPVVTLPSPYLRCRISAALYQRMEMTDLVARDKDHYVELAVALGKDRSYRNALSKQILEKVPVLYDDTRAVTDLADLFERLIKQHSP